MRLQWMKHLVKWQHIVPCSEFSCGVPRPANHYFIGSAKNMQVEGSSQLRAGSSYTAPGAAPASCPRPDMFFAAARPGKNTINRHVKNRFFRRSRGHEGALMRDLSAR